MAVLMTGADWKADVVSLQEPPGERTGIGMYYMAYESRKTERVRTALCKGMRYKPNEHANLSNNASDIIFVVFRKRRIENTLRSPNMYNQ